MNLRSLLFRAALVATLLAFAFVLGLCVRLCEAANADATAGAPPATQFLSAGPPLLRLFAAR